MGSFGCTLCSPGRPSAGHAPNYPRSGARLPLARAAQPTHGDMPPQGDRRQTPRGSARHRPAGATERLGQAAGFKGRGAVVAALLALALLSYGLMILAPQRIDLLPADSFTLPATAAPAPDPASPSGPAVRHA